MPAEKTTLLIVEDDVLIRQSLSFILGESGYKVRSAEDGFSALAKIKNEVPDLILSDLNMPGMSGFELLSVVRRRFPAIRVVAMSGAFSGDALPPGVAADAFFEKGSGPAALLKLLKDTTQQPPSLRHPDALTPIWIVKNGHNAAKEPYVMIACPECLRTFPQVLSKASLTHETNCINCGTVIHYAIVQPIDFAALQSFPWNPGAETSAPSGLPGPAPESRKKRDFQCVT